jgi:hypothetical protein
MPAWFVRLLVLSLTIAMPVTARAADIDVASGSEGFEFYFSITEAF